MSAPHTHFKHCPSCGAGLDSIPGKSLTCDKCGFTYFFNPTIGLAGFIENEYGDILLIKRGKNPAKGKFAPPGGFADVGESAETALSREVFEEVGLEVEGWSYLTSAVNYYTYKDVTYPVLDFFYYTKVSGEIELQRCTEETESVLWMKKDSIEPESLAFPSMQEAFRKYLVL